MTSHAAQSMNELQLHKNTGEMHKHIAEQEVPDTKEHALYDSILSSSKTEIRMEMIFRGEW